MSFDKAALFAALKPKSAEHEVDGFGKVQLRQLSVKEVDAIRAEIKKEQKEKEDGKDTFGLRLVVLSLVDAEGSRVLSMDDLPELEESSITLMDGLVGKALEVNGFRKPEKN
jgi:hypothetical protein